MLHVIDHPCLYDFGIIVLSTVWKNVGIFSNLAWKNNLLNHGINLESFLLQWDLLLFSVKADVKVNTTIKANISDDVAGTQDCRWLWGEILVGLFMTERDWLAYLLVEKTILATHFSIIC